MLIDLTMKRVKATSEVIFKIIHLQGTNYGNRN